MNGPIDPLRYRTLRSSLTLSTFTNLDGDGLNFGSLANHLSADRADSYRCASDDQVHNPRSHDENLPHTRNAYPVR